MSFPIAFKSIKTDFMQHAKTAGITLIFRRNLVKYTKQKVASSTNGEKVPHSEMFCLGYHGTSFSAVQKMRTCYKKLLEKMLAKSRIN